MKRNVGRELWKRWFSDYKAKNEGFQELFQLQSSNFINEDTPCWVGAFIKWNIRENFFPHGRCSLWLQWLRLIFFLLGQFLKLTFTDRMQAEAACAADILFRKISYCENVTIIFCEQNLFRINLLLVVNCKWLLDNLFEKYSCAVMYACIIICIYNEVYINATKLTKVSKFLVKIKLTMNSPCRKLHTILPSLLFFDDYFWPCARMETKT